MNDMSLESGLAVVYRHILLDINADRAWRKASYTFLRCKENFWHTAYGVQEIHTINRAQFTQKPTTWAIYASVN